MNKLVTLFVSSLMLVGAHTANATTYSPTGTWIFEGTADVYKGINLTCDVTLTVNASATSATATMTLAGGFLGLCSTIGFPSGHGAYPYTVTYNGSTSTVTLKDVYVDTITAGDCFDDINAIWNGNDTISINDTVSAVSGADCIISNGFLSLTSPAGPVTITP